MLFGKNLWIVTFCYLMSVAKLHTILELACAYVLPIRQSELVRNGSCPKSGVCGWVWQAVDAQNLTARHLVGGPSTSEGEEESPTLLPSEN